VPPAEQFDRPITEPKLLSRLARVPARARYWSWVTLAIVCGVALRWGALNGSLLGDDWDHYAMEVGIYPVPRALLDKYNFVARGPGEHARLLHSGRLPWWSDSDIQLAVWRPLSSALVHFDFGVLDAQHKPWRQHWHSLFWWVLLLGAVASLLAEVLPLPAAAAGLLLYSMDDAHVLPIAWSANRSELVSIALVTWGLYAHVMARTRRVRGARAASLGLVALGLLAGEHGLAPLAYFVSFECASVDDSLRHRLRSLMPFAALTISYLAIRTGLGYAVTGSSFYIDPFAEPARYFVASLTRLPVLCADLTLGWASDWWYREPAWRAALIRLGFVPARWLAMEHLRQIQVGLGVLTLAGVGWFWMRTRRARVGMSSQSVRWLLLGAVMSLLPMCAALPMSRLTVAAAIGFDAAFGYLLWRSLCIVARRAPIIQRVAAAVCVALIVQLHAVRAAERSYAEVNYYAMRSHVEEDWVRAAELDVPDLAHKHVIIVSARDWASQFVLPFVRHAHGLEMPASSEVLSAASDSPHELTRVAANVLELGLREQPVDPPFLLSVYRRQTSLFHDGEIIPSDRFDVAVLKTVAGEPTRLRFTFRSSLDDPRYVFLYPMPRGLVRLRLPRVGERVRLPAPAWPSSHR
jgi:hypothetical protein